MRVDIAGEDPVTREILKRLIDSYGIDLSISNELPVRGGQIKRLAPIFNRSGMPIIMLTDMDDSACPPGLIHEWFEEPLSPSFLFRIAYDEAESWLIADREGFSKWLSIDISELPSPVNIQPRNPDNIELSFNYKPSLYLMLELVPKCRNKVLKEMLSPRVGAKKGPGYNTALLPYVQRIWDIDHAMMNSYSLRKAVQRIREYHPVR